MVDTLGTFCTPHKFLMRKLIKCDFKIDGRELVVTTEAGLSIQQEVPENSSDGSSISPKI